MEHTALNQSIKTYVELRKWAGLPDVTQDEWTGAESLIVWIRKDLERVGVERPDLVEDWLARQPKWAHPDTLSEGEIDAFVNWFNGAALMLQAFGVKSTAAPKFIQEMDTRLRFDAVTRTLALTKSTDRDFRSQLVMCLRVQLYYQFWQLPDWEYFANRFMLSFITERGDLTVSGANYLENVVAMIQCSGDVVPNAAAVRFH